MTNEQFHRYIYWSDRMTREFMDEIDKGVPSKEIRKIASPGFSGYAPIVERTVETSRGNRSSTAKMIEKTLEDHGAVFDDFSCSTRIGWARGTNYMILSEFRTHDKNPRDRAMMYSELKASDGKRVGVCLFGSVYNYAGFVVDSPPERYGWTSSAANDIRDFLQARDLDNDDGFYSPQYFATEAVNVARNQGEASSSNSGALRPWERGYNFGDLEKAEWLADILFDVDVTAVDCYGLDRVLIGAPMWIRGALRDVRLYAEYQPEELESHADSGSTRSATGRLLDRVRLFFTR